MDLELPSDVTVQVHGTHLQFTVAGTAQKLSFNPRLLKIKQKGNGLQIDAARKENRPAHAAMVSLTKHVANLLAGLKTPFVKKMTVVFAHFPVTLEVKPTEVSVKNFLGEKMARTAKIAGKTKVEVKGQDVTVSGPNKDDVGQTAANLRKATRIVKRDERVFQDGIYYNE